MPRLSHAQDIIGPRDSLAARVDALFRAYDRSDSPGCAVGVFQDGRIVYARGYGMANLELGVANSPRTVFDVASMTKQFTATAILLLAQEGKLSLSDGVRRYLPELPAYADGITIAHLLNHTSGLRDYLTLLDIAGRGIMGPADTVDILRVIRRSRELNFPVGTRYSYTSSGFVLLGQIVYRVTGKSLAAFLRERVLEPLGMKDTRLLDDRATIIPNRAQGYVPYSGGFGISSSLMDGLSGGGSLHTSIVDLAHWDHNWDDPTVGGHPLIDSLVVHGKLKNDSTIAYARGVIVDEWRGVHRVWHGGNYAGYRALFFHFPAERFGVSALCNLSSARPDTLALQVAAIYLGTKLSPDPRVEWESALRSTPAAPVLSQQLRAYAGLWRNVEDGQYRLLRVRGDSLMVGALDSYSLLVPLGAGRFRMARGRRPIEQWSFGGGTATQATSLRVTTGPVCCSALFSRVAVVPSATKLAAYAGDYRSEELEITLHAVAENTHLVFTLVDRPYETFERVSRDLFIGDSGDRLEFMHDPGGHIKEMALGVDVIRLRFVRLP